MSLVGNIISIVALVLTISVYATFKSMRTSAGVCVMQLAIAMFLAQLGFQVGFGDSGRKLWI